MIGIVLMFTDEDFVRYKEFDTQWYIAIGSSICFTMVV